VTVADLGAFAKQRVGFVKKQHRTVLPSVIEELTQVLFGFPNPFANYCSQIDSIQVRLQFVASASAARVLPVPLSPAKSAGDAIATALAAIPRSISMGAAGKPSCFQAATA